MKHLLLALLFLCNGLLAQQNPQPYFRNYGTEDGLPSPEVHCVFEDSKGFMWFGTDNGAARFDGYGFEVFGAEQGLLHNVVLKIKEDTKGRIWLSTMLGETYIYEQDSIYLYPHIDKILAYSENYKGVELGEIDKSGTAYFSLNNVGILAVDSLGNDTLITSSHPAATFVYYQRGLTTSVKAPINKNEHKDYISICAKDRIDSVETLIFKYDTTFYQLRIPSTDNLVLRVSPFQSIFLSSEHLLVSTVNTLSCIFKGELLWAIPFLSGIVEFIEGKDQSIWFCMGKSKGLRKYESVNDVCNNQYELFLKDNFVTNFLSDSKGNYWVTTHENGIFYAANPKLLNYYSPFGLSSTAVNSLAILNDSTLYTGQEGGTISLIDYKNSKVLKKYSNLLGYHNTDLFYNKLNEKLWAGAAYIKSGEWYRTRYYNKTDSVTRISRANDLKNFHLSSKKYLIANSHSYFLMIDTEIDSIFFLSNDIMKSQRIQAIHTDFSNRLWLGQANGLYEFKDSSRIAPNQSHPAFKNRVEAITQLPDSTLVFGTKGCGVMLWKGDSVLQVSEKDGLTSNMLEDVHVDENGILWAATLNGLNKIIQTEKGVEVRAFTTYTGLPSNEIYQIKSYKGQVWLCTTKGLVKFYEHPENKESPAPILQWVKNNEAMVNLSQNQFAHDQNNFEFRYLTLNYRMQGRIPYRYRLQSDAPWQYTQNLTVNYPALPRGKYAFEVQSQNEDRYWSERTFYPFEVLPPWWATWWFRTLAIAGIGGLVYWFYHSRIQQLEKENAFQQQVSKLEKAALQAQMNPHFIFNSLTSIQNFILDNEQKSAVEYLARFAKLVRHNLNASVEGSVTLAEEVSLLENYLALEQERFEQGFDFQINVAESIDQYGFSIPPLLIQPYVENAVQHGLSKRPEKGKICINFQQLSEEELLVSIKDNGIGYQNGETQNGKGYKSVGMSVTKKRLELLNEEVSDIVRIKNMENENGKIEGTEVTIKIKGRKEIGDNVT
ncbi:MAG: histidine kinase [Bacteroidota bacterium]